jgi:pimeloyl-ACP methyl ester carboxylesterase
MDELTPQNISKEGLTVLPPLSTPGNVAVEQNVDIVFLHGFGGDPRGTWENKVSKFYWPAQLRKDIPEARIMVYGYDTAFKIALSQNRTTIKAIAEIFVSRLVDYRQEALRDRPLILVAHSLGGLVVKRVTLISIFDSRT